MIALSRNARQRVLFAILCLVWGATWLALKVGVTAVPPGIFSGLRWTVAGLALLAFRRTRGYRLRIRRPLWPRLVLVAVLMVLLSSVIQNYGLRYVPSGLSSVINAALTPIALLGFGVAFGQERFSRRQAWAIALGVIGIFLLFGQRAVQGRLDGAEILGALGIITSCLCYTLGSVLCWRLTRIMSPADVAASTNLIGGVLLIVLSLLFEPGAWQAMHFQWGAAAWAAWLFLLLPGALGATTIYFILVRDWGASRTGTYAFVSPVVAVLLGVALLGEQLDLPEALGMLAMLTAAALVLRRG